MRAACRPREPGPARARAGGDPRLGRLKGADVGPSWPHLPGPGCVLAPDEPPSRATSPGAASAGWSHVPGGTPSASTMERGPCGLARRLGDPPGVGKRVGREPAWERRTHVPTDPAVPDKGASSGWRPGRLKGQRHTPQAKQGGVPGGAPLGAWGARSTGGCSPTAGMLRAQAHGLGGRGGGRPGPGGRCRGGAV